MIRSMTGYGSAKGNAAGFEVSIEIKSVNNRNLETSVRLPRSFLFDCRHKRVNIFEAGKNVILKLLPFALPHIVKVP